jgi:hypothetical protein
MNSSWTLVCQKLDAFTADPHTISVIFDDAKGKPVSQFDAEAISLYYEIEKTYTLTRNRAKKNYLALQQQQGAPYPHEIVT